MKEFFPTPCSPWAEKLAATHADDLSSTERLQLEAHLASCSTCSAIRAEYEIMGQAISQLTGNSISKPSLVWSDVQNARMVLANEILESISSSSLVPMRPSAPLYSIWNTLWRKTSPVISTLAAVLVVVALLSGFLVLMASHHPGKGLSSNTGAWHIIPSANPGSTDNSLLSVAALSATDAWAVGFTSNTSATQSSQPLIEHWNGTQWSVFTSPNLAKGINLLNDVIARASDDVWAVGFTSNTSATQSSQPLIEHWNGSQWSIVSTQGLTQQLKGQSITLSRLLVLSANNVWGVGTSFDQSGHSRTLIAHWNGSTWSIVHTPNPGSMRNAIYGVVAVSANDIWAVGYFSNDMANTPSTRAHTLIEHWDGLRWSIVASPEVWSIINVLNAATAVSANDIWAIGVSSGSSNWPKAQTLIEHWNGERWSIITSPHAGPSESVGSMAAIAANDIWAVGYFSNGSYANDVQAQTLHWDGHQWLIIHSPNPAKSTLLSSIGKIPGSNSVWAVGYYNKPDNKTYTLALLYR